MSYTKATEAGIAGAILLTVAMAVTQNTVTVMPASGMMGFTEEGKVRQPTGGKLSPPGDKDAN